jgi:hypothetical protein
MHLRQQPARREELVERELLRSSRHSSYDSDSSVRQAPSSFLWGREGRTRLALSASRSDPEMG